MSSAPFLITAASWEPRFIEGSRRLLERHKFCDVVCLWFTEFGDRTQAVRRDLANDCKPIKVKFIELPMYSVEDMGGKRPRPAFVTVWTRIKEVVDEIAQKSGSFILDITTMPREALLITLDLLTEARISGTLVYHRAREYGDWCSSEPERPHIVPKLGGVPSLDWPTKLLITSGYDEDRSEQFIASYEPQASHILFQEFPGSQSDSNELRNEKTHKLRFKNQADAVSFSGVNCYSADWGFSQIFEAAITFGAKSNLILSSLGPKTSAVSLYRVHRIFPESCLVYAPCRNYNESYSIGIGATLEFEWNADEILAFSPAYT